MRWKITIEGMDEFSGRDTAEMVIEKEFNRLSKEEIGRTISGGKMIMACLRQLVVKQQCEAYVLTSRYCSDCETFQHIKDSGKRKIRTVFGRVEVSNPRTMNCRRCLPYFFDASAVLRDICPDQATPELMELSARMGSLMPYRKAPDILAEFLPIPSTESKLKFFTKLAKASRRSRAHWGSEDVASSVGRVSWSCQNASPSNRKHARLPISRGFRRADLAKETNRCGSCSQR